MTSRFQKDGQPNPSVDEMGLKVAAPFLEGTYQPSAARHTALPAEFETIPAVPLELVPLR